MDYLDSQPPKRIIISIHAVKPGHRGNLFLIDFLYLLQHQNNRFPYATHNYFYNGRNSYQATSNEHDEGMVMAVLRADGR